MFWLVFVDLGHQSGDDPEVVVPETPDHSAKRTQANRRIMTGASPVTSTQMSAVANKTGCTRASPTVAQKNTEADQSTIRPLDDTSSIDCTEREKALVRKTHSGFIFNEIL